MKKALFAAFLFLVPFSVHAYTTASAINTNYINLSPSDSSTFLLYFSPSYLVATGTTQSIITYFLWTNTGTASSGAEFYFQGYRVSTGGNFDCQTSSYSADELAIPTEGAGWSNAAFLSLPVTGTECDLTTKFPLNDYGFKEHYPASPGQPIVIVPSPNWYIFTTDATSSIIYQYQNSAIGISTTTTAAYCNATYAGLSLGSDIANALCNVTGFLFVPSTQTLFAYQALNTNLSNKIPFSYFFDVKDILQGLTASTTGSGGNFQSVVIDFSSVDPTASTSMGHILPSHFEALSTTTIRTYVPDSVYNTLFLLMRSAIWVAVGLTLYRKVVPHKAKI